MLSRFQKTLLQNWKKFNSYVFYLWWNDVRISKIIVENFWKILIFMYCIVLWLNDMRISQIFLESFETVLFLGILLFCDEMM